jgi:hypothetical protein
MHQHGPMMRSIIVAALVLVSSPAAPAPDILKPTGKWIVDYDESQCTAQRAYGSEEKPLHLVIKPSPTSDVIQLLLVKDGPNRDGIQTDASIGFDGLPPAKVTLLEFGVEKKRVKMVNLPVELASRMAASRTIYWDYKGGAAHIDTGPLADLMKVLANCRDDLREYWNITDAKRAALQEAPRPVKPLFSLFSADDYPSQAIMQRETGMTSFVLLVDEKGAIRDCMVDGTSGIATLDAMTCVVIRSKAKFEPAIGADGKPVRGSYMQRVRWMMPQTPGR